MRNSYIEWNIYAGESLNIFVARLIGKEEFEAFLCDDQSEIEAFESIVSGKPPYRFEKNAPVTQPCRQHEQSIVELVSPPSGLVGWPYIVAVYSPKPFSEAHRYHWTFDLIEDENEASRLADDLSQDIKKINDADQKKSGKSETRKIDAKTQSLIQELVAEIIKNQDTKKIISLCAEAHKNKASFEDLASVIENSKK